MLVLRIHAITRGVRENWVRSQGIIQYEKAKITTLTSNSDNVNTDSLVFRLIDIIMFYQAGSLRFPVKVPLRQILKNHGSLEIIVGNPVFGGVYP